MSLVKGVRWLGCVAGVLAFALAAAATAPAYAQPSSAPQADAQEPQATAQVEEPKPFPLPFLADEARKRGIELPLPFGAGLTYLSLHRAVKITDVRVGRNGAPPVSVSQFAQFSSFTNVNNLNLKLDVWLFPFLDLYAFVGGVWNKTTTNVEVTLPPILPNGAPRSARFAVPTELNGSVGGLGLTLAAGYGSFFAAGDVSAARADLGFDDRFKAIIGSVRAGWHGEFASHPVRAWVNWTYWDTATTPKGTVSDPDGGTLSFEVDQGPLYSSTYGAGLSYGLSRRVQIALDGGTDFHGGWYVVLAPVFRF